MAGVRSLIGLALAGSTGLTLLILACTLHGQNWWPAIVLIFYVLVPIPILISKQVSSDSDFGSQRNPAKEWAYFTTTGIIISAIALPIIMARAGTLETSTTVLSIASSAFSFSTILAFFVVFQSDDNYSSAPPQLKISSNAREVSYIKPAGLKNETHPLLQWHRKRSSINDD